MLSERIAARFLLFIDKKQAIIEKKGYFDLKVGYSFNQKFKPMKTSDNNKYSRTNKKVEKWIKGFGVVSILLFSFTFSLLFSASFNEFAAASSGYRHYPPTKKEIARKIRKAADKKNQEDLIRKQFAKSDYFKFVRKGERYLSNNRFKDAQTEFVIAMKLNQTNKEAYIGMTKTLVKKCAFLEENCTDAADYIDFLLKSKFISKKDADALRSEMKRTINT